MTPSCWVDALQSTPPKPRRRPLRPQMAARSLTFPQDDPQPKPHGPIPIGKRLGGVAHAAIVPPSSDHPIQARHQFRKVYPQTAPLGLLPDLGAHPPQRLPPRPGVWDEPPRPLRRFLVEMAPEDVNACVCPPDQPRLVRMELQLQPLQDTTDALLRRYRLLRRAADDHEIVGVALEPAHPRMPLLPPAIPHVQVDVGEHGLITLPTMLPKMS